MLLYVFNALTSMSSGRRVILCMGRMRKEIIGRFLQSGWLSILVSTSLKTGFLDLQERTERKFGCSGGCNRYRETKRKRKTSGGGDQTAPRYKTSGQSHCIKSVTYKNVVCAVGRPLTPASAGFFAGRPRWSNM